MYEVTQFTASVEVYRSVTEIRDSVTRLATYLTRFPQEELPVNHEFLDGVYMRTVFMKAGLIVVGKIHKQEHVAIISQGDAWVMTEDGLIRVTAPYTIKSKPGARRALYILEDMVWTTVHRSDETDLEKLEEQLIAKDFNDPLLVEFEQKLRAIQCRGDS